MTPKHIVIVNDFAHVNGGAGQVALGSALALAERGYEVSVFSAVGPGLAEFRDGQIKLVCTHQQEIARDPNRLRASLQGLWNREAARRFDTLLGQLDPTNSIVHLHGWSKSLSSSVCRTAIDSNIPTVLTMHDYFLACPNGGFYNYQKQQICRLKAMSSACLSTHCDKHNFAQKLWRVGRQSVQAGPGKLPGGIQHFITISDFSRRILEPYLPDRATIHAVTNPISVEKQPAVEVGKNASSIFIGRLEPEKGPELLARAAQRAGQRVTLVGEGSLSEEVLRACPGSEVTGWLALAEVQANLQQARCLVLPSRWYETQGLVVLEAAARGVPAIVPDDCAASDLVVAGETGLIFRTGDVADLERALREMADPDRAAQLGARAYECYWANPATMARHLEELLPVYEQMLVENTANVANSETISTPQ